MKKRLISPYIITNILLILVLSSSGTYAQHSKKGQIVIDETRKPFFRIGIDPTIYLNNFFKPYDNYGGGAIIETEIAKNYIPVAEVGYNRFTITEDYLDMRNSGIYFKFGLDKNFTKYTSGKDRDIFSFGFRYAFSVFRQNPQAITYTDTWRTWSPTIATTNHIAHWAEITVGTRVKLWDNVMMGWTGRGKIKMGTSNSEQGIFRIPGLGNPQTRFITDINVYLLYNINLKK